MMEEWFRRGVEVVKLVKLEKSGERLNVEDVSTSKLKVKA
jgi:hypothetical protein